MFVIFSFEIGIVYNITPVIKVSHIIDVHVHFKDRTFLDHV